MAFSAAVGECIFIRSLVLSVITWSRNELFMNLATFIAKITMKKNTEKFTPAWAWSCRLFSSLLGPSTKWPECITCFIYSIPRLIEVSLLNITSTIYGFSWLFQQRNPSRPLSGSFLCLAVRCCHSSGMSTLAQVINKSLARSFTFPEESKNCTPNRQYTVLHQKHATQTLFKFRSTYYHQ